MDERTRGEGTEIPGRYRVDRMTFGSLFAGVGGFDLGLERAGMTCKWQVENNEFCQKVLTKHWPDVPKLRDIRECGAHNLPPVDLICGGFPCQPFSVAGKRRGQNDDRYLWPEMRRVIEELRPAWVIGENVPGIIRMGLDTTLADLESLGYSCRTFVIPACALGAPHIRARVWIVAHSSCPGRQQKPGSPHENENEDERRAKKNHHEPTGDGQGSRSKNVADSFSRYTRRDNLWGTSWSWWWEREPLEALQHARERGGEEDVLPIPESLLGRVANGVPSRMDRLKSLGNAVVPQIAEFIGRRIMEVVNETL